MDDEVAHHVAGADIMRAAIHRRNGRYSCVSIRSNAVPKPSMASKLTLGTGQVRMGRARWEQLWETFATAMQPLVPCTFTRAKRRMQLAWWRTGTQSRPRVRNDFHCTVHVRWTADGASIFSVADGKQLAQTPYQVPTQQRFCCEN